jgi:DNA-directed RNA polymerase beta' subunit
MRLFSKKMFLASTSSIDAANYIQISLAGSEEIQNWAERSYFIGQQFVEIGEVKRPDTLNYRTFKPEKDGLFCERIFGPVNDWTCSCGQIKEQRFALDHERALLGKFKPKVCPNCQVEVTSSRLRRYRMGYISLACPVTHIWYLNSRPSLFSILLKMPTKYIKKIAYYKAYSPSSKQREYMSACLGPGGDFFDNEWEFLHFWLSGKHSIEDIPSRTTKASRTKAQHFEGGRLCPGPGKAHAHNSVAQKRDFMGDGTFLRGAQIGGKNQMSTGTAHSMKSLQNTQNISPGPMERSVNQIPLSSSSVGATPTRLSKKFASQKADKIPKNAAEKKSEEIPFIDLREFFDPSNSPGPVSTFEGAGPVKVASTVDHPHAHGEDNVESFADTISFDTPANERTQSFQPENEDSSEIFRTSSHFYPKMPECPEWLANTGAQALLNHLKSRDWQKESEKLEAELQSTPSLNEDTFDPLRTKGLDDSSEEKEEKTIYYRSENISFLGNKKGVSVDDEPILSHLTEKETDFLLKRRKARVRTLKLLKSFQKSGLPFTGMIFHSLPVLPPELRPIIQLGAGQLASSDVNDLYRRILSRNNRLKYYLYETHFVEFLVRSEQQLVQLAVDALLENGKTTSVRHTSGQKRLYKSLSDRIGGKQGRFRMNLLGKRVDYSGRSVIVVGPRLKLFQCGLPYEMAVELFQPFLLRHMLELQLAKTIRAAKNILRFNKPLARQLLHHVVQAHPILLNRAPTLHRLGIQAFQPVLVFGRAIHLHPLVCPAFNADFDGDQMAVHIPLSPQARIEARLLMLASGNWLSASTGQPNVLPSQDMVLGFYYLTIEKYAYQKGRGLFFPSLTDVMQAYEMGSIDLHSQIWVKWYGPFTGDSTSRLTSPQKHGNTKQEISFSPQVSQEKSSSERIQKHFKNKITRFRRDAEQPIEIRLNKNGISTKIYSSYSWQQDSDELQTVSYIRTTPGRVLMNQIFQTFS